MLLTNKGCVALFAVMLLILLGILAYIWGVDGMLTIFKGAFLQIIGIAMILVLLVLIAVRYLK